MTLLPTDLIDMHAVATSQACRYVYMPGCTPGNVATDAPITATTGLLADRQVSIKKLFAVASQTTAAGSKVLANAPAAGVDSLVNTAPGAFERTVKLLRPSGAQIDETALTEIQRTRQHQSHWRFISR